MRSTVFTFSILLFFLSNAGIAQTLFGPRAGLSLSTQSNNGQYNVAKTGLEYGVFIRKQFSDKVGLLLEALITQKGYKKSFDEKLFDQLTTTYFNLPVMFSYRFAVGDKALFLNTGPYYGRWMSGKYSSRITKESEIVEEDYVFTKSYDQDGFKDSRNEWGLVLGAAVTVSRSLLVDIRYLHGLSPVEKRDRMPIVNQEKVNQQVVISFAFSFLKI